MTERIIEFILNKIVGIESESTNNYQSKNVYICDSVFPSKKIMDKVAKRLNEKSSKTSNQSKTYVTNN
ncbi:hypothetical protein [uncultured Thomasclavelia sp.]|uniref:hypothetical protein n=1 Tax=uncultured Thomasclavelia sp. TaxID=3025759 RepID=UPI0026317E3D|nr:hypothetical protein [uncultured Thomasclavelia sp.]